MIRNFSLPPRVHRVTLSLMVIFSFHSTPLMSGVIPYKLSKPFTQGFPVKHMDNSLDFRAEAILSYNSLYPGGFSRSPLPSIQTRPPMKNKRQRNQYAGDNPQLNDTLNPRNQLHTHRQLYTKSIEDIYSGKRKISNSVKQSLKDYPLAPYIEYHEFRSAIHSFSIGEINTYILSNPGLPVAKFLKTRKLFSLAKTKQWNKFIAYYSPNNDTRLKCHLEQALLETKKESYAFSGAKELWLVGQSQPKSCDKVFNAWLNSEHFHPDYAWERYILALRNKKPSLSKHLIKYISKPDQKLASQGLFLYRHPEKISLLTHSSNKKQNDLLQITLQRLIQKDPEKATELIPLLTRQNWLNSSQIASYREELATILAVRFHPKAEEWLKLASWKNPKPILDELEIRTALRKLEWKKVYAKINALPESRLNSDRWQYWKARASEQIRPSSSEDISYEELAQNRNFYGYLSRSSKNTPLSNIKDPLTPPRVSANAPLRQQLLDQEGIKRAWEFLVLDQQVEARREWFFTMASLNPEQRLIAAQLAKEWNMPSLSIRAANSANAFNNFDLRFPIGYKDEVSTHAKNNGLDQGLVFALIRQESLFTPDARSHAGALGMMQIMPATAKRVAKQHNISYKGTQDLLNPNYNIRLGTTYLKQLINRFDANEVLAMAAYNAGPHRVSKWIPEKSLPMDVWIETIPFKETRNYVKHILSNQDIYREKLGLSLQKIALNNVINPT